MYSEILTTRNTATAMRTGETKMRFGRCPYCRTMIYQNPKAVIYYCSKCRTPIRGKDPEPMNETDYALSRLEILSADTASVFSDELDAFSYTQASLLDVDRDQPPLLSSSTSSNFNADSQETAHSSSSTYRGFSSARVGSNEQDEVWSPNKLFDELRPSSRRTRRPSSSSEWSILRYDLSVMDSEEGYCTPRNACEQQQPRQRSPPLSSQELGTSITLSGPEPTTVVASPLTDPAFHRELLQALDNLRNLIAAIELQPRPASSARAVTRRDSRFFRRLESQLAQALPADAEEHAPRWNASIGASCSSASSSGHGERPAIARKHQCRPILGGAPFVVCGSCSELLQTPTTVPSRRRVTRLRCGGCEDVLELTLPAGVAGSAHQPSRTCSAPRASGSGSCYGSGELERAVGTGQEARSGGELLPLHRALGCSSPSPLLQSRRHRSIFERFPPLLFFTSASGADK